MTSQVYGFFHNEAGAETLSPALPAHVERLAECVLKRACAMELRLAVAESCTGGLLSALLTDVEGTSHAFERGFIVYSVEAKQEMLGVDAALITDHGAVSAQVAMAMAKGVLERSNADVALAITGFAGIAQPQDEEGLVYIACIGRAGFLHTQEEHFGAIGRSGVRVAALHSALCLTLHVLTEDYSGVLISHAH